MHEVLKGKLNNLKIKIIFQTFFYRKQTCILSVYSLFETYYSTNIPISWFVWTNIQVANFDISQINQPTFSLFVSEFNPFYCCKPLDTMDTKVSQEYCL